MAESYGLEYLCTVHNTALHDLLHEHYDSLLFDFKFLKVFLTVGSFICSEREPTHAYFYMVLMSPDCGMFISLM